MIGFESKVFVPSMQIIGDQYINNTAIKNGGAMFLDWESLSIERTDFIECKAQNGGALYFINVGKKTFLTLL